MTIYNIRLIIPIIVLSKQKKIFMCDLCFMLIICKDGLHYTYYDFSQTRIFDDINKLLKKNRFFGFFIGFW